MKRKRSLQGVFLMEKCEMKGLIKTDSVIVILYFVKIYTGKEFQKYLLQKYRIKIKYKV